jgi:hypothetical protein
VSAKGTRDIEPKQTQVETLPRFGVESSNGTVGGVRSAVLQWTYKSIICNSEANLAMMSSLT